MKAFAVESPEKPAGLVTLPDPEVGARDVLVAIRAASVNGFDVYQASGYLVGMMEHRFPTVIGRDLAGIVEAIGPEVTDFAVGDAVFGFVPSMPPLERGTFAERISSASMVLVPKPSGLDFEQAAALPLAGAAALDLLDAVDVKDGDTILVVGATGGVGSFAVQLAAMRGATVIATAAPADEGFVLDLGANHVVDHTGGSVVEAVRSLYPDGITTLIDVASQGDALTDICVVVSPGGRVASLLGAADVEYFAGRDVQATNVNAVATVEKLQRLGAMAMSGELRIPVQEVYSLDHVEEALEAFRQGKRGKLIVRV
ncbi:MAG: NADP-dependent oxidoreductase [Acidimicrobiia bacterium]